jgi:hypothetical protein
VRFLDVNNVEGDAVLILPVKLVERGNLPAEWRSSITAEDEDDGLLAVKGAQSDFGFLIQSAQMEIACHIPWSEGARSRAGPERFEGENHEQWSRHFGDGRRETLGRLAHDCVDRYEKNYIHNDKGDYDALNCPHDSL